MKNIISVTVILLLIASSCQEPDKKKEENTASGTVKNTLPKNENFKPANLPAYSIYPITTGDTFTIKREIDSRLISDTVHVKLEKPGTLSGVLRFPGEKSNLRFNQVIDPSGKTEGPFGKDFSFKMDQSRDIMIVVGSSQMAEGAYKGPYSLYLKLTK